MGFNCPKNSSPVDSVIINYRTACPFVMRECVFQVSRIRVCTFAHFPDIMMLEQPSHEDYDGARLRNGIIMQWNKTPAADNICSLGKSKQGITGV